MEFRYPDSQWDSDVMIRIWERGSPARQRRGYTRPRVGVLVGQYGLGVEGGPRMSCQAGGFRVDGWS